MAKRKIWIFIRSKPWATTDDESIVSNLADLKRGGIDTRGATAYRQEDGRTIDAEQYAKSKSKRKHWWERD